MLGVAPEAQIGAYKVNDVQPHCFGLHFLAKYHTLLVWSVATAQLSDAVVGVYFVVHTLHTSYHYRLCQPLCQQHTPLLLAAGVWLLWHRHLRGTSG
jgi:hypothetical protein